MNYWKSFYMYLSISFVSEKKPLLTPYWDCFFNLLLLLSVQFCHFAMSDSFGHHGLQYARSPCLSPIPRVYSNLCPLSQWCHPTISSSVIPFSRLQSFPASESFLMSQFFSSSCQSIGVLASTSVLPMNIQDWFPLGWTGRISLLSKGLSMACLRKPCPSVWLLS